MTWAVLFSWKNRRANLSCTYQKKRAGCSLIRTAIPLALELLYDLLCSCYLPRQISAAYWSALCCSDYYIAWRSIFIFKIVKNWTFSFVSDYSFWPYYSNYANAIFSFCVKLKVSHEAFLGLFISIYFIDCLCAIEKSYPHFQDF